VLIAFVIGLLVSAPSSGSSETSAPEIVVEAERLTDRQIEAKARQFVRNVLPVPSYGQYARWTQPVCPKVSGLAEVYDALVEERVRRIAETAGVPLAKSGCRANLLIVFSADARITADVIVRRKPKQVAKLDSVHRERLMKSALPVRWWHVLQPTDGSGAAVVPMATALSSAPPAGEKPLADVMPVGPDTIMTNDYNSSLVDTNLRLGVTSAVVLVDIPLSIGKPLNAVADYVALIALAPAKLPPDEPGVPSILGLFGSDYRAKTLTQWDKAYLAALYRIELNRSGRMQRGQIINGIKAAFQPEP
jgi:hypothetical protein